MNFDLSEEQKAIQDLARDFAQREVRPAAEEMDREAAFPYGLVAKMAALGFMGLPFPEEYGGAGADTVSYALAVMEIARADASTGITMAAHVSLGSSPFYLFGTEEQKQTYLVPLARGRQRHQRLPEPLAALEPLPAGDPARRQKMLAPLRPFPVSSAG